MRGCLAECGAVGKYDTVTNSKKNSIWKSIADKINSLGYEKRSVSEIKGKWKNLCSHAKISWNEYKKKREKTGGGPAPKPLSSQEQDVIAIFQGQPRFEGLDGFSSFHEEEDFLNSFAEAPSTSLETSMVSDNFQGGVSPIKTVKKNR